MSNNKILAWFKRHFTKPDGETLAMWGLFAGSGLLALGGDLIRKHLDQKDYRKSLGEEVQKQAAKMLKDFKNNDGTKA